jgi:hypothetical protein
LFDCAVVRLSIRGSSGLGGVSLLLFGVGELSLLAGVQVHHVAVARASFMLLFIDDKRDTYAFHFGSNISLLLLLRRTFHY